MKGQRDVSISVSRSDAKGQRVVTAVYFGVQHVDTFNVNSARSRQQFICAAARKFDVPLEHLDNEIIEKAYRADDQLEADITDGCIEDDSDKKSQATQLVELAADDELFHDADCVAYASLMVSGCRQTWPLRSREYRGHLQRRLFERTGKVASSQAVQDALGVLEARALFDNEEQPVAVRLAAFDDAIWLDLADDGWRAVRITSEGWSVCDSERVPVRFLRRQGMQPLPTPSRDGDIEELRPLANLPDDAAWKLLLAFLVVALRPEGPYPVLIVNGEQGSAKSTLCRVIRELIDPNVAPLRRPPRDERDLVIAASNSWLVAYNNLSSIPQWLSDSICSLTTEGGFATRQLYTDGDEKLFHARRPVVLNGIDDLANSSDLIDRAVTLTLPVIPDEKRCEEEELLAKLRIKRASILGALLDAVVSGLRNRASVRLPCKPRMADFAVWAEAAGPAFGWAPGTFMAAYSGNRNEGHVAAIESSAIGPAIVDLLEKQETWEGTATQLLHDLEEHDADAKAVKQKSWPKNGKGLGSALRRIAPNLRAVGHGVTFREPQGRKKTRLIILEREGGEWSAPSAWSANGKNTANEGNGERTVADHRPTDADGLAQERPMEKAPVF